MKKLTDYSLEELQKAIEEKRSLIGEISQEKSRLLCDNLIEELSKTGYFMSSTIYSDDKDYNSVISYIKIDRFEKRLDTRQSEYILDCFCEERLYICRNTYKSDTKMMNQWIQTNVSETFLMHQIEGSGWQLKSITEEHYNTVKAEIEEVFDF